ncbi:hypothetical protein [Microlunatus soli]|uniref:hypothetical protein n=1 Tax=Microlunatus soli TaxID=630515 RepID=UPI0012F7DFF6|nr:hypothetical protein [Microlunatus soli]
MLGDRGGRPADEFASAFADCSPSRTASSTNWLTGDRPKNCELHGSTDGYG